MRAVKDHLVMAVALIAFAFSGCADQPAETIPKKTPNNEKTGTDDQATREASGPGEEDAPARSEDRADERKTSAKPAPEAGQKHGPADSPEGGISATDTRPPDVRPYDEAAATRAMEIVDEAIAAAGGLDLLREKLARITWESKAEIGGQKYNVSTVMSGPDRFYVKMANWSLDMAIDANLCWRRLDDVVSDCLPDEAQEARQQAWLHHLTHLYPLRAERIQLEYLGRTDFFHEKNVDEISVSGPNAVVPMSLLFNDERELVGGTYQGVFGRTTGALSWQVKKRTEAEGMKLPKEVAMHFAGNQVSKVTVIKFFPGKFNEEVLARPAQGEIGKPTTRRVPDLTVLRTFHPGSVDGLQKTAGRLLSVVRRNDLIPVLPAQFVFLKMPRDGQAGATEVRLPVAPRSKVTDDAEGVRIVKVPKGEVVRQLEIGPIATVLPKLEGLHQWAVDNNYAVEGPPTLVVFRPAAMTAGEETLVELSFPVKKRKTDKKDKTNKKDKTDKKDKTNKKDKDDKKGGKETE